MEFQFNILTLRGIGLFIVVILNLFLTIILWRRFKEKTIFWLSLTVLFSAFYAFFCGATYFFWDIMPNYRLFWYRTTWLGILIIPPLNIFIHHFVKKIEYIKIKIFFWYLGAATISYLALVTPYMIKSVYLKYPNISGISGNLDILGRIYLFIGISIGLIYLLKEYFKTQDQHKKLQIKYLVLGLSVYMLAGIIAGSVIPAITGESAYYDIIAYFSAIWIVLTTYAILKHHLLDIRIIVKKAFISSIVIAVISGLMMTINLLSEWFAGHISGFRSWIISAMAGCATFIIGYLFWKKSKEIEKIKYEFMAITAGQLKIPLIEMRKKFELLIKILPKNMAKNNRQLIFNIRNAVKQTIELLKEFLVISKIEAAEYLYKSEKFDLGKTAINAIKNFQDKINAKRIKLTLKIEKKLPKTKANKKKINLVINIMLENAVSYTSKKNGKIKIEIKQDGDYLFFSITDNGIGISKEDRRYIFTGFFRTSDAYLIKTEGVGIKLFIAKNIIARHHGKIGVKSKGEGMGSTFWFKIPIK